VVNLYDQGIVFEPIHRVIFGAEPDELLGFISRFQTIRCKIDQSIKRIIRIEKTDRDIATVSLEPVLEEFVRMKGCAVDYIHGEDEVSRLVADSKRPATGIILPPVRKDGLFKTVAQSGPLPRKSFSMGEPLDKRFYLECRKLFG